MPEASVIVRARNEEALIGKSLSMVTAQTYRDIEIVVVDSGSTDSTPEIAGQFTPQVVRIPPEDFTFGYALNVGCRQASGRFGVILSAHAVPCDEHWLSRLLDPFAEADVAATWGSEQGWADSVRTLPGSLAREVYLSKHNYGPRNGVWGFNAANGAIRLDLWRSTPFDERLPASEDKLWAWKQIENGYRVVYVPRAGVYHSHHLSPMQTYRRAWREHRGMAEFMPDLKYGLWDVARGTLKRPRRGLWTGATQVGEKRGTALHSANYLALCLACRFMYHWGLYRGLKDGRAEHASRRGGPV